MKDTRPRDRHGRILGARHRERTQREYETQERAEFGRQLGEVESAPLADRKEAAAEFLEAMRDDPALVGERVGWLIGGDYGKGGQLKAWQVMLSARANKAAQLTHMVAAVEWQCPAAMAIAGWKKLTAAQKKKLDAAVNRAMRDAQESA